jgi:outer membrane protein OmpA-like peptidoglycan-associated protein
MVDNRNPGNGPVTGRPGAGRGPGTGGPNDSGSRGPGGGIPGWLKVLLGVIVLGALLMLVTRGCTPDENDEETAIADTNLRDGQPEDSLTPDVPTQGNSAYTAAAAGTGGYATGELGRYFTGNEALPRSYQLEQVTFASGSAELSNTAQAEIADIASALQGRSTARVALRGYADPEGDAEANQQLSEQRAEAVRVALVRAGASPAQVQVAARGETGDTATAQNRRVELTVLSR